MFAWLQYYTDNTLEQFSRDTDLMREWSVLAGLRAVTWSCSEQPGSCVLFRVKEEEQMPSFPCTIMSKKSSYLVLLVMLSQVINVSSDVFDLTVSGKGDEPKQRSLTAAAVSTPVFKPAGDSIFSLNMLSSFPEDLEISDYCIELLQIFGQRYVVCANCFVSAARPVKVCANCFSSYVSLNNTYANISENQVRAKTNPCSLI